MLTRLTLLHPVPHACFTEPPLQLYVSNFEMNGTCLSVVTVQRGLWPAHLRQLSKSALSEELDTHFALQCWAQSVQLLTSQTERIKAHIFPSGI